CAAVDYSGSWNVWWYFDLW
nr:immunoglobulin heavy chain junction region [Macaca mulatta]